MKNWIFLFITSFSILGIAQSNQNFEQINKDYEKFISPFDQDKQANINKSSTSIRGEFPNHNFEISNQLTVSTLAENDLLTINQQAIILSAIFNNVTYEYVADLFNTSNNSNSVTNKELLKLSIAYAPDSLAFSTISNQKINKKETITQFAYSNTKKLTQPIEIIYYTSTQEINNHSGKSRKILIKLSSKTLYEISQNGNSIIIKNKSKVSRFNNSHFQYSDAKLRLDVKGGLFYHILLKRLEEISTQVLINSTLIKNVNDVHSKLNKGISRSISKGTTENKEINIRTYIKPQFDTIQNYETNENEEQIIEWYSKHNKKSETQLMHNILNGPQKRWASNGNLIHSSNYLNGELHGDFNAYYDDLTPKIITQYKNGAIDKSFEEFHPNGVLKKQIKYQKALKHGYQKEYYSNGKIRFKGKYKKNQPSGWHIFYDQNGNPIKKNKYRRGVLKRTKVY